MKHVEQEHYNKIWIRGISYTIEGDVSEARY